MKRNAITYPVVKVFRPLLFWRKCKFCNKEFVREEGYKIMLKHDLDTYYCCNDCGISIDDVKNKVGIYTIFFIN